MSNYFVYSNPFALRPRNFVRPRPENRPRSLVLRPVRPTPSLRTSLQEADSDPYNGSAFSTLSRIPRELVQQTVEAGLYRSEETTRGRYYSKNSDRSYEVIAFEITHFIDRLF